jgi:hypothetical protein
MNPTKPNSPPPPGASELLPHELLWADGGHASDVVLTSLADGQHAIVPLPVRQHVERCTVCTTHLGHAALLSLHVANELEMRRTHERAVFRRPLPKLPITLGLAVAVLGLLPTLLDDTASLQAFVTHDLPLFAKGLGRLAGRLGEPGSPIGLFLTYFAAMLLVSMGIALVRFLPKKEASR